MDHIDEQIKALQAGWAAEEEAKKEQEAEARRARMKRYRDRLLSGEWRPSCCCSSCLRGVLTMDPSLVCLQDLHTVGDKWWR
jgi:hypothetical protein